MNTTQPVWNAPSKSGQQARPVPLLEGRQARNPHPEDVRVLARNATYPNAQAEAEALRTVDQAVFDRAREWENYLVATVQQARADAVVDTTAAQEALDALQSEVRWALDRPVRELDMGALAARYKQLKGVAEKVIEALERADQTEETFAAKCADPYGDLVALWDRWPMIRPLI